MTIYTKFSDIPAANLSSLSTADRAALTYWMLVQTGTMPIAALPKNWNVQEVVDALPLNAGKFGDTLKVYAGDPVIREYGRDTVKSLHTTAKALSAVTDEVLDWCTADGFARIDGNYLVLDGVLRALNPNAPKAPTPSPDPAYASDIPTVKVTEPSPAAVTVPPSAPTATTPKPVHAAAPKPAPKPEPEVIPAPPRLDFTEKELRGIRIALELIAENQTLPRPSVVTPRGDSPVLDCARELAVLLAAFGTGTRNALRERVRVKLRPFTSHALEFGVQQGCFVLVGSPVRGGEYSLVDPEPLDLSWSAVKGLAARKKPLRQLAGSRGT